MKMEKLSEETLQSGVPIIAETFPDESESSIKESILFQPEIRRSLKPSENQFLSDGATLLVDKGRGSEKNERWKK